jgi:alpha-L-fucosidase
MAHMWGEVRAPNYQQFAERKTPTWFKNAKFGIFVHWGLVLPLWCGLADDRPYSVPAWAETTGELGYIPEELV